MEGGREVEVKYFGKDGEGERAWDATMLALAGR